MKIIAKLDPKNVSPILFDHFFRHFFFQFFSFLHLEFQINKFVNKGRDFLVVKRFFAEIQNWSDFAFFGGRDF